MKLERLGEFRVVTLRELSIQSEPATTPDQVVSYFRNNIEKTDPRHNPDVETLFCLVLSTRRKILGHFIVATGLLDSVISHPREVFRSAIVANAAAIILIHNHPSGDPSPSEADIKVTRDLIRAGQLLKIEVLDHVIAGQKTETNKGFCSLRELGYFYA